jgi:two-component system sensor histidine kinase UhpB
MSHRSGSVRLVANWRGSGGGADDGSRVAALLREFEAERRRLAELLNDEPVQTLAHVSRSLQSVAGVPGTPVQVSEATRAAGLQAAAVSQQLRRLARLLRPSVLDDLGLGSALRQLTSDFAERSGITVRTDLRAVGRAQDPELDIILFRVAEEALIRVAKDESATQVDLRLRERATRIILTVRDNGERPGAPGDAECSASGFLEMRERLRSIRGQLTVRSAFQRGTVVVASAPTPIDRTASRAG